VRAAGIDLGKVRVGLAVSDELGMIAHPRPHLDGRNPGRLIAELEAFARAEGVDHFLVGLPRQLDGREGPPARRARRFARQLAERSGLTVELVDEWLTTVEARARLRDQGLDDRASRHRVDSAAAAILLQAWLDARREPE
jgi:putative holliday junction resolvase